MSTDSEHTTAEAILADQTEQHSSERFRLIHDLADQTMEEASRRGLRRHDLSLLGGLLLAQSSQQYIREQLADLTLKVNYLCQKLDVTNEELYAYIEFLPDEESDTDAEG